MEKIKTTLHPKDSPNDELYPNVLPSNIPVGQGLINTGDKLSIDNTYIQEKLTNGVGINIDENKIGIADSVTKQVEFTQGIKTSKIVDTNGYSYLTSDTSYVNVGNSSRLLQTYGSGSRPTYNGKDLALLSDSDTSHWDLLMENLGTGRWADQQLYVTYSWGEHRLIKDILAPYYKSFYRTFSNSRFINLETNEDLEQVTFNIDFNSPIDNKKSFEATFYDTKFKSTASVIFNLQNKDVYASSNLYTFKKAQMKSITFTNGTFYLGSVLHTFQGCSNLVSINGIDASYMSGQFNYALRMFMGCTKLKTLNITNITQSINISYSTAFEEADLVQILNNLHVVSTTQTLTIGSTNLAKLTTDDILIATGKGWQLA